MTNGQHLLFYRNPARCWEEALPLGNGRIGAMVYGRADEELIELNEDTLWGGRPRSFDGGGYFEQLGEARRLLRERRFAEADEFISSHMLHYDSEGYLPAGRLKLRFAGPLPDGEYRRELELSEAVAATRTGGLLCEWFVSAPHQVLVMRCTATVPGTAGFALSLDSPLRHTVGIEAGDLFLNGVCPVHARGDEITETDAEGRGGIRFEIRARLLAEGGTVAAGAGALTASGADSILLLVAIRSDFRGWNREPAGAFPAEACRADLDRAAAAGSDALRRAHIEEHQLYYRRSSLELPEDAADALPTDERLAAGTGAPSPALAALLYNYGRYLLLASSRPGTEPANLQGIWNRHTLPPWGSNYTTNINLEMNYWSALPANLAECAEPLFRFLREAAEAGKETAERLYHARGWCLHHNSDLWRFTYPATGQARWAYWPVAGLWLCRHICEYYRFTGNLEFLREAYPLLRGSAAFALDLLTGDESGALGTSPSTSPENGFLDPESGRTATVCACGSSMDLELIRECFLNLAEAAAELGLDEPLLAESEPALARLRRPGIGEAGQLLEYDEAYEEAEPHHRHLSHLYGVYPGELFTPDCDPERYEAARISLIRRGDRSTGWAMCWRLALWARFRDGGRAEAVLKEFLTPVDPAAETSYQSGGIYPNLLSAHPPFQIDANLGIPAAIAELLVQSHRRSADGTMILDLLPALPPGWEEGKLTGVRARNGVTLDLAWKNSRVAAVRIRAAKPVKVELNAPRFTRRVEAGPEAQFLTSYQ